MLTQQSWHYRSKVFNRKNTVTGRQLTLFAGIQLAKLKILARLQSAWLYDQAHAFPRLPN